MNKEEQLMWSDSTLNSSLPPISAEQVCDIDGGKTVATTVDGHNIYGNLEFGAAPADPTKPFVAYTADFGVFKEEYLRFGDEATGYIYMAVSGEPNGEYVLFVPVKAPELAAQEDDTPGKAGCF